VWWETEDWGKGHVSGGPSLNKAWLQLSRTFLVRALSYPPQEVLGAYGAASACRRRGALGKEESTFRGIESAINDRMSHLEMTCRADSECHNQCKLKTYNFDGRKAFGEENAGGMN